MNKDKKIDGIYSYVQNNMDIIINDLNLIPKNSIVNYYDKMDIFYIVYDTFGIHRNKGDITLGIQTGIPGSGSRQNHVYVTSSDYIFYINDSKIVEDVIISLYRNNKIESILK